MIVCEFRPSLWLFFSLLGVATHFQCMIFVLMKALLNFDNNKKKRERGEELKQINGAEEIRTPHLEAVCWYINHLAKVQLVK